MFTSFMTKFRNFILGDLFAKVTAHTQLVTDILTFDLALVKLQNKIANLIVFSVAKPEQIPELLIYSQVVGHMIGKAGTADELVKLKKKFENLNRRIVEEFPTEAILVANAETFAFIYDDLNFTSVSDLFDVKNAVEVEKAMHKNDEKFEALILEQLGDKLGLGKNASRQEIADAMVNYVENDQSKAVNKKTDGVQSVLSDVLSEIKAEYGDRKQKPQDFSGWENL
jgi:hypothetical protein